MVVPFYLSLSVVILTYLAVSPKKLRITESIFIWLTVTFLIMNYTSIVILNQKWIRLTENRVDYWGFIMNRNIITPALYVLLINNYITPSPFVKKWASIVCVLAVLAGLEYMGNRAGITVNLQWNLGYSAAVWLCVAVLTYWGIKGLRLILAKEAGHNGRIR